MPRGEYDRRAPNGKKPWTEAEENYIKEAWGKYSLATIARNLGRSRNAVTNRIQKLHLGPGLMAGGRVSWNVFIKTLTGTNSGGYAKKRLLAAGFPVHTQIIRGHNKKRYTMVDIDEFWKFAEQNKDLFDFSRLEPLAFGPEPEWAALKRRLDAERLRNGHAHNEPWTEDEDRRLVRLLKKYKYTYSDLAAMLHRSEGAIKRRIITKGIRDRPVRAESRAWTEAEEKKLVEMRIQGYGWDNIAAELKRTSLCVRGKYERLLNPEYSRRAYRNAREGREKHDRQKTCCHFVRLAGCGLGRQSCSYCRHYEPLAEGQKQKSEYIGIREIRPEEIEEHRRINELTCQAEWQDAASMTGGTAAE